MTSYPAKPWSLDPIKRLKDALRDDTAEVYLLRKNPDINSPTDQYLIVAETTYARFSLVEGQFPAQRDRGNNFQQPPSDPIEFGEIPVPMRHALAGWFWALTGGAGFGIGSRATIETPRAPRLQVPTDPNTSDENPS